MRRSGLALSLWLALALPACGTGGGAGSEETPADEASAAAEQGPIVAGVRERGPYLDVVVRDGDETARYLALPSEACRFVLIPETRVSFTDRGIAGRLKRADVACDLVGFGDPRVARSRGGRPPGAMVPRAQATFGVLHEDAEVIGLRGRFPLANLVGFGAGDDCVAFVRNVPVCREAVEEGVASMEFRARGPNTLALVGGSALCRIDALALPPPPAADPPAPPVTAPPAP